MGGGASPFHSRSGEYAYSDGGRACTVWTRRGFSRAFAAAQPQIITIAAVFSHDALNACRGSCESRRWTKLEQRKCTVVTRVCGRKQSSWLLKTSIYKTRSRPGGASYVIKHR